MCKDDDIASADERCNIRQPFLGIRLDRLDRFVADTDMAPGMACECPAVCFDRIGYFFRLLALFIPVEIRVCIKPCYLIIRQIFSRLVITVGAVSEDSIVAGQCYGSARIVVYGIRMRFDKLIHQRDAVVSTGHNSSVILNVFAGRFSVVADYHFAGNAASVVRVVIGKVIQRKNECFLALRQVNVPFLVMNGSVIIYGLFHEIVDRNHDISSVVHLLGDRVELIHGGHPLAEACGLCVVLIERFLRIDYKRMIENVGYFVDVDAHTGISRAGVLCYFCDDIRVGRCALYALELFNGSIVIVCLRKCIGFRHNLCFRCRRFSTSRAVRRYGTVHLCCFLILFFLCFLLDFFCSSGQSPDSNAEDDKQNT